MACRPAQLKEGKLASPHGAACCNTLTVALPFPHCPSLQELHNSLSVGDIHSSTKGELHAVLRSCKQSAPLRTASGVDGVS